MTRGVRNTGIEAAEQQIGQKTYVDMAGQGDARSLDLSEQGVELVDGPALGDYAAELAFMEEPVEVIVHESNDPNAEPLVDLYCNGVPQRLIRGEPQTIKRKYVQILADARQVSMNTVTRKDGENVINRINKHSALRYPFSVQLDRNPKGREWLKKILATAR